MSKAAIIDALLYLRADKSFAYRDVNRALAQVDADQRSESPFFDAQRALAPYMALSPEQRHTRLREDLSHLAHGRK